ncbi:MAG TPA: retropepsin-like aspartic protease, partial [Chlamydiales bacterium]|nr:retropepsin-like aspartic protease [Chlamydiales bacterium]
MPPSDRVTRSQSSPSLIPRLPGRTVDDFLIAPRRAVPSYQLHPSFQPDILALLPQDYPLPASPARSPSPNITIQIDHAMEAAAPTRGAMPAPGSNRAPKTFEGDEDAVAEFLERFEDCAEEAKLSNEDKVKFIFRYLTKQQKAVFKAFKGFQQLDWDEFKSSIQEAFEGAFDNSEYTKQTLIDLVRKESAALISTDAGLRRYQRDFHAVANVLISEDIITEEERDRYFWFGFHENIRQDLQSRLIALKPNHSDEKPYKWEDVAKVGKSLFNIKSFMKKPPEGVDAALGGLHSKSQGGHQESQVTTRLVNLPSVPKASVEQNDIEDLLARLDALKANDKDYASTYARLVLHRPDVAKCYPAPYRAKPAIYSATSMVSSHQAHEVTQPRQPCLFCKDLSNAHGTRFCPVAKDYLRAGRISQVDGYWRWPDGARIPNHPQGIKFVVDQGVAVPNSAVSTQPGQQRALFFEVSPVTMAATAASVNLNEALPGGSEDGEIQQAYEQYQYVLAAAKEKKTPTIPNTPKLPIISEKKSAQYEYKSNVEDFTVVRRLFDRTMSEERPIQVSQRELLAISPELRKLFVEACKVNRVPLTVERRSSSGTQTATTLMTQAEPLYTSPVMELDVAVNGQYSETGIYDPGAELVCISEAAVKELKLPFTTDIKLNMRDANGGCQETFGLVENLGLKISNITIPVHAWIIRNAPYRLLLGRTFQVAAKADTEDAGETLVIQDPVRLGVKVRVPMRPHRNTHSGISASSNVLILASPLVNKYLSSTYEFSPTLALKYKPVDRKVRPVATTMPDEVTPKRRFPENPLKTLIPLTPNPHNITT